MKWHYHSLSGSSASYLTLRRLTHSCKATIAVALEALERLGVLSRVHRRVWTPAGSRKAPSAFLWHVRSPWSGGQATGGEREEIILRIEYPTAVVEAAKRALADRCRVMKERLLAKGSLGLRQRDFPQAPSPGAENGRV